MDIQNDGMLFVGMMLVVSFVIFIVGFWNNVLSEAKVHILFTFFLGLLGVMYNIGVNIGYLLRKYKVLGG